MKGLFTFIEQKEAQTQQAKALVLPLLQFLEPDRPWSSKNFWTLYQARPSLEPVVQQALEHLRQYAIPLLEYEEQLSSLDLEAFSEAMSEFERRFWQEQYAQAKSLPMNTPMYLCGLHSLEEPDVRVLVQQRLWDVEIIASALGVPPDCPTCKRGIQRIVLEDIKRAKTLA